MSAPIMTPSPGERLLRFVGDRMAFKMADAAGIAAGDGWRARLRTNLGRGEQLRREIIQAHTQGLPLAGASWRDIPMVRHGAEWRLELPLTEVGFFKAKAYLVDPRGWQHWPAGEDVGISVHPDGCRTGNSLYCAFVRLFGTSRFEAQTDNPEAENKLKPLDEEGYTVIPPSGKLRDLTVQLPHIFGQLGCRILHLLPVNPTPTTYARFGRFGSPYAALDLTAIDPALVVFDKISTGVDQFRELTYAAHLHGGRVFLDMVINHTGWGSLFQENRPEWFLRGPDGTFVSPGAWGVTWEDLVELKHQNVELWDELAEAFLTWCRRGVDGFRCDAGYMVPMPAWQYIIARVQQEYPETVFLLEGLGGAWDLTEALLTEGGMQWAYSELFQNYSGAQIANYLDHSLRQSQRVGLLVNYSETHDNERLAARGRGWSLLRNRLCALASVNGGFGFTCGVEWLAAEKIRVHGRTGLAWGAGENLVPELARLNELLAEHPCFFDGAHLERLTPVDAPVYALRRISQEGLDLVLVLINGGVEKANTVELREESLLAVPDKTDFQPLTSWKDLLGQPLPEIKPGAGRRCRIQLPPGAAYCLASVAIPRGLSGEKYRRARQQAAWGLAALAQRVPAERIGQFDWRSLATAVDRSPAAFLAAVARIPEACEEVDVQALLEEAESANGFSQVVHWTRLDCRRVTPVPAGHWLLVEDEVPFRACLASGPGEPNVNLQSIRSGQKHIVCFAPRTAASSCGLRLERYTAGEPQVEAEIRFLGPAPAARLRPNNMVLLTNGRGGMTRMCVDLGRVLSKYDCVLGANLHPSLPVDRHIFIKRMRVWVNADGFISPLNFQSLESFRAGPPAVWNFVANAGDGRTVQVQLRAAMLEGKNTTVFEFSRPTAAQALGKQLPAAADVRLSVRLDVEDRNFHWETKHNGGADHHFNTHTQAIPPRTAVSAKAGVGDPNFSGFRFTPAGDRALCVTVDHGLYHPQAEWSEHLPHRVEQSRGQIGSGDAFSPGWFELPLSQGSVVRLVATAEPADFAAAESGTLLLEPKKREKTDELPLPLQGFGAKIERAIGAFLVRRGEGKTVIAGYPWFLDWGRDTFICARGLLAAGMIAEVRQIVLTFANFEKEGTLPNTIFGEDASNRDTSDAPLWFGLVCEELAQSAGAVEHWQARSGRSLLEVLRSIASHYISGTPNGIRMDQASGLIWSPSHFTWMDTNYPAATPREGYPIEIQALWIRLLQYLGRIDEPGRRVWLPLAEQALASVERLFWLPDRSFYADVLAARDGRPAAEAMAEDALRSNCLFLISLGLATGERAQNCAAAALRYLVVPGALRSLAPLPVSKPAPVIGNDGRLLNDPLAPYWGRYEGDEDTRRKPAYHNGTAWTWTLPTFCEALARAWNFSAESVRAAQAYLESMEPLLDQGCLGQLPEILDGDIPHTARGCDAQAWAATEALRVLKLLESKSEAFGSLGTAAAAGGELRKA